MIDVTKVQAWMKEHRDSCHGGFRTYSWFGMSWPEAKAKTQVECAGCGAEYLTDEDGIIRSFGSAPEKETKNSEKQDAHEKSISSRKIGKWKVRTGR